MMIPYKIYSRDEIKADEGATVLSLNEQTRQCWLVLRYKHIGGMAHIGFHAASAGWEFLTNTGYRSFFIDNDAAEYFKDNPGDLLQFLCDSIGLEHSEGEPVQCPLF